MSAWLTDPGTAGLVVFVLTCAVWRLTARSNRG